jgi:diaminopimelate decarboxylase
MPLLTAAVVRAAAALARRDALPSYVYDLGHLDAHLTVLAGALRGSGLRAELLYAVKANPEAGVLEVVARHVDGFEVASGGELAHVRALVPGARLHLGGPGKTDAELAAAVAQGVHRVHVESLDELRRLDAAARRSGATVSVLLRVNVPDGPAGGVLAMSGGPSPFGMDPAEANACVAAAAGLPGVAVVGVHGHLSSGLDADACAEQAAAVLRWATRFGRGSGLCAEVNVGGGMRVDYTRPEERFDWADYGRRLAAHLDRSKGPPDVVRLEPGRALTAYSGWYATRVVDLKCSRGEWFAVCLGGTHHLRTPAAKSHDQPLAVLPIEGWDRSWTRRDTGPDAPPVTFVGQLCTPKDVLGRRMPVGRVRVGDVVVFALAGAYADNISHHDFLMHPRPGVVYLGLGVGSPSS